MMIQPERLDKLKIQCLPNASLDRSSLNAIIGAALPHSPTESTGIHPSVFWTAPGEWLLVSPLLDIAVLRGKLEAALHGTLHALTDVSDSLSVIELKGARAGDLLREGCGADLDERAFSSGRYALTRLEQLPVILHRIAAKRVYRVYVERSFSEYLWDWLADGLGKLSDCRGGHPR